MNNHLFIKVKCCGDCEEHQEEPHKENFKCMNKPCHCWDFFTQPFLFGHFRNFKNQNGVKKIDKLKHTTLLQLANFIEIKKQESSDVSNNASFDIKARTEPLLEDQNKLSEEEITSLAFGYETPIYDITRKINDDEDTETTAKLDNRNSILFNQYEQFFLENPIVAFETRLENFSDFDVCHQPNSTDGKKKTSENDPDGITGTITTGTITTGTTTEKQISSTTNNNQPYISSVLPLSVADFLNIEQSFEQRLVVHQNLFHNFRVQFSSTFHDLMLAQFLLLEIDQHEKNNRKSNNPTIQKDDHYCFQNIFRVVNWPLISVIITTYRNPKFFESALYSLILQSWPYLEIVVVDDRSYAEKHYIRDIFHEVKTRVLQKNGQYSRLRLFKFKEQPRNYGPYVAKNIGIRISTGQFITFHDSDDFSCPDRILRQYIILQQAEMLKKVGNIFPIQKRDQILQKLKSCRQTSILIDENLVRPTIGTFSEQPSSRTYDGVDQADAVYVSYASRHTDHRELLSNLKLVEVSMMIKRDDFVNYLGNFDSVRVAADSEIRTRLSLLGKKIVLIHEYLYICLDKFTEIVRKAKQSSLTMGVSMETNIGSKVRKMYVVSCREFYRQVWNERIKMQTDFMETYGLLNYHQTHTKATGQQANSNSSDAFFKYLNIQQVVSKRYQENFRYPDYHNIDENSNQNSNNHDCTRDEETFSNRTLNGLQSMLPRTLLFMFDTLYSEDQNKILRFSKLIGTSFPITSKEERQKLVSSIYTKIY